MPPVAALAGGIASAVGGAAAGVAGLAGAAASAVGSVASGILGGAAGLAGGAASAVGSIASGILGGSAAEPIVAGTEAAFMTKAGAAVSEVAALGVPAATAGVSTGLSTIATALGAGVGLYGQLAEIEAAKEMTEAQKIAAQKGLIEAETMRLYAATEKPEIKEPVVSEPLSLGTLSTLATMFVPKEEIPAPAPAAAQPVYVTPQAAAPAPNYMLYIGLAILAFMFLGKK